MPAEQAANSRFEPIQVSFGTFPGVAGVPIRRDSWKPAGKARAALVLSHGMSEYGMRYDPLARFLAARGVAVHSLDHRGHGHSGGETGTVEQFSYFLDDLAKFMTIVLSEEPGIPLVLLGHSMGGLIAAACVLERQPRPDLLVLSGPAIVPVMEGGERRIDATRLSRDPEQQRLYLEDPMILRERVRDDLFPELFSGISLLVGRAGEITEPVLLIHGTDDRLCSAEGAKMWVEATSSSDITVKLYEGGRHEMFNETNRAEVFGDLWSWLDHRIPSAN
jgi:alpha-beta hydrolase superfamily lysophospholipase